MLWGFLHVAVEMALQPKGLDERESEAGSKMETGPCSSCLATEAPLPPCHGALWSSRSAVSFTLNFKVSLLACDLGHSTCEVSFSSSRVLLGTCGFSNWSSMSFSLPGPQVKDSEILSFLWSLPPAAPRF